MHFFIYKASAGSGKTYTLVKEYLKMALQEEDPYRFRRILAITFTNKAAAEMKERVIQVLHAISSNTTAISSSNQSLLNSLAEELKLPPQKIQQRAAKTLSAILHQYSDFAIGTIDSFMHRVVRTFAHDLHLPVNFSVELDQEVLLRQAIEQVLEKVGDDEAITRAMIGFTELRTDEEKSYNIQEELFQSSTDLLKEQTALVIRKLSHLSVSDFLKIRKSLQESCQVAEAYFRSLGKKALELMASAQVQETDFFQGKSGIGVWFRKLANMEAGDDISPNSYVLKALIVQIWTAKKVDAQTLERIESIQDRLHDIGMEALESWKHQGPDYILNNILRDSIYSIALLNEISRVLDQIRDEQFIVHISEFNRRVADIVFNEPAPFIFERLGEKYHHYLIDEFQDTSILQWQNLLPLIQNGLSENYPSLIVGDGKQAIYRFRGGEVEQFARMPEPYPENLKEVQKERYTLLKGMFSPKTLDTNYRSKPEIVHFNNRLYSFIQENQLPENFKNVYDDQEQLASPDKTDGYIQLEFVPADLEREDRDMHHLKRCEEIIRDLIDNKKYRPRDIAILTRNNNQGTMLASHLLVAEIPVISSESLLVQNAPEVGFLISWMHILIGSNSSLNLLSVCNFLIHQHKLPYTTLESFLTQERIDEKSVLAFLKKNHFDLELSQLRKMSLLEACFRLCELFGISIQSNTYLQFFLEAVWNTGKSAALDIPLFLEYWEEKKSKLSISLPQDANAVRVMTVHKSKGLQFPVVILPFAYGERPKTKNEWIDNEELLPEYLSAARVKLTNTLKSTRLSELVTNEEERRALDAINLLYVATTRPEDALYILSGHSGIKGSLLAGWETYLEQFASLEKPAGFAKGLCSWGDEHFENARNQESYTELSSVVHEYSAGKWQKRITISRQAAKNWDVDQDKSALALGKLVHKALSYIETEDQTEEALTRLLQEGSLSIEKASELKVLVESVTQHPQLNQLFKKGNRVFSERELLLPDGNIVIPDRVTERDGEITLIDYKTGLKRNEHQKQVSNYLKNLKELNYSSYKAYLVYLGKEIEIVEVLQ